MLNLVSNGVKYIAQTAVVGTTYYVNAKVLKCAEPKAALIYGITSKIIDDIGQEINDYVTDKIGFFIFEKGMNNLVIPWVSKLGFQLAPAALAVGSGAVAIPALMVGGFAGWVAARYVGKKMVEMGGLQFDIGNIAMCDTVFWIEKMIYKIVMPNGP